MRNRLFHEIHQKARLSAKEVNETLKAYGLFSSQWSILVLLNWQGPMTQTAVWQYLNVEAPTVTRTLVRLEETGWVRRKEGRDKRERIVLLTEKAEAALPGITAEVARIEEALTCALSAREQEQLTELLGKIRGRDEREGSDA